MYTSIFAQDIGTRWRISWGSCPSFPASNPGTFASGDFFFGFTEAKAPRRCF